MILLDTHAFVWFVSGADRELSAAADTAIKAEVSGGLLAVSSISVWEIAMLAACHRIRLDRPLDQWLAKCESLPFVKFIPVDNAIAVRSVGLPPPLHKDPADRIIAATSLALDIPLVTKDRRLREYVPVATIW